MTPSPDAPTVLDGKYRLDATLGQGTHGAVFAATHQLTGRRVAVKVLREGFRQQSEALGRFQREAQISVALAHPGTVEVIDLGWDATFGAYLVMELLEGETLRARLDREGTISPEATLELLARVLDALEAAHARGVIHRDLKPENLFIPKGAAHAKILDFGTAKARLGGVGSADSTAEGTLLGTPAYMAPEQIRGAEHTTAATDLWALGAVLYECVTGARPFSERDLGALLRAITQGTRRPVWEGGAIPRDAPVARAIEACLVVDPAKRCASVAQLRALLGPGAPAPHAQGTPGDAPSPGPLSSTPQHRPPAPWLAYAVGALAAGSLLLAVGYWLGLRAAR